MKFFFIWTPYSGHIYCKMKHWEDQTPMCHVACNKDNNTFSQSYNLIQIDGTNANHVALNQSTIKKQMFHGFPLYTYNENYVIHSLNRMITSINSVYKWKEKLNHISGE